MSSYDRRPEIDNLRSAACFLLIPYHVGKVFDRRPFYHVKNGQALTAMDVFTGFVQQWHMPLLFLLAGWSTARAFDKRTKGEYRRERLSRLLVPLAAWTLILGTAIRWVELDRIDHVRESFLAFLPTFFTDLDRFTWSHLWFLAYLLAFSLLYLPLFARLGRRDDLLVRIRHLVAFVGLLVIVQVSLRWRWPGFQNLYDDWGNFSYYSLFFVGGFFVGRFPSIDRMIDERRRALAGIGFGAAAAMLPFWAGQVDRNSSARVYVVYYALSALAGAGVVGWILGAARRRFAGNGGLSTWARRRAFPAYVLHQIAVVFVAVHVVDRLWPISIKVVVTLIGSASLTLLLVEIASRIRLIDPLFGGRSAPPPTRGLAIRTVEAV